MGTLLFCQQEAAKIPFAIENMQINVYSMEELCFYIRKNTYLLDQTFMSFELCTWIDKECGRTALANQLRPLVENRGSLSEFVMLILKGVHYCTTREMRDILLLLKQMEEKSDFECGKIRADKLLESERYIVAIYEYRRLLDSRDAANQTKELIGNVWHNLGTAYTRLFLYEEAAACYNNAYNRNNRSESLKELLYACLGLDEINHETYLQVAKKYHLDDSTIENIRSNWKHVRQGQDAEKLAKKLDEMAELKESRPTVYQKEISSMLDEWKDHYRRICHI